MAKRKQYPLGTFMKQFATEEQCREYLAACRWKEGYVCPECGCRHAYRLSNGRFQCAECRRQSSVTAGTVLHKTHIPLTKWFFAFYFVCYDKRGISAVQLASMLGMTYKTAWYMLARIRVAMGQRNAKHQLSGVIEFDDSYFGGPTVGQKRGRGTEKAKVFGALSLDHRGNPRYLKMQVTENIKKETVKSFAQSAFAEGSTIHSDGYRSYVPALEGYTHQHEPYNPDSQRLRWLHIAFSNAKAFIVGTYHGLSKANLQSYLDEYCFRFCRRSFGSNLVDRLVFAVGSSVLLN